MYSMSTCTAPSNITAQRLHELKLLLCFYSTEPIFSNKLNNLNFLPLNSQDSFSDSPYCLLYNSFDVSLENLKLDQSITPLFIFFLYSHCFSAWYLTDSVRRNSVSVTGGT